ncbi:hypothetical protein F7661_01040 [Pseudomonas sp. CFA]|nr:hypothetical protein F7661_01040 [Pseudomonas sp. CFA]
MDAHIQEARSKKQEARSKKQEARSKEQEARSKKQGARSKEQEARSKEQEARSKEQGAKWSVLTRRTVICDGDADSPFRKRLKAVSSVASFLASVVTGQAHQKTLRSHHPAPALRSGIPSLRPPEVAKIKSGSET